MSSKVFRLGTRKSALATTQSTFIQQSLKKLGVDCVLVPVESDGDGNRTTPLYEIEAEAPGLFTKRLEEALLAREIDLAVHSLKDLPTLQPPGLFVGAVPARAATGDCLILRKGDARTDVPWHIKKGARFGTSSLRREAQWLAVRPDLCVTPIRGNVPTRLDKVRKEDLDGIVLAQAGLERLGEKLEGLVRIDLPENHFVPAPGQGALAVELGEWADPELSAAVKKLHHEPSGIEVTVERRVLRALEGGCTLPLGVRCWHQGADKPLKLQAFLGIDGGSSKKIREWKAFELFDFSSPSAETLVAKTVEYFKEVNRGR